MKLSKAMGLSCALLGSLLPAVASAQTPAESPVAETAAPSPAASVAPAPAAPVASTPAELVEPPASADGSHATGFMVQGRLQTQSSLISLAAPGFMIGYQAQGFALGVQLGLTRVGISATPEGQGETSASATLYQIEPTAMFDIWRSADGRARANLVAGVGFGRASVTAKGTTQDCVFDPNTGVETCSNSAEEQSFGASFIPLQLGIGGDYYLSRNFALGLEGGFQGLFVTGVDSESNGAQADIAASANMQLAYGVIRATLVLGD